MLCCAVIALLLSPLGFAAARARAAGRPDCCPKEIPVWPFVAGGAGALAICVWLAYGGGVTSFAPLCTITGH
jgi:hypothetical protein